MAICSAFVTLKLKTQDWPMSCPMRNLATFALTCNQGAAAQKSALHVVLVRHTWSLAVSIMSLRNFCAVCCPYFLGQAASCRGALNMRKACLLFRTSSVATIPSSRGSPNKTAVCPLLVLQWHRCLPQCPCLSRCIDNFCWKHRQMVSAQFMDETKTTWK